MTATTDWHNCYDDSWKGMIVDDAMAHPAKYAPGLIRRMIEYGMQRGWWTKGDLIADPFGGIGSGGVMAAGYGLRWCGVELEQTFVDLAMRNFELHRRTWELCGDPMPVIVQGDSRRFAEILSLTLWPEMVGYENIKKTEHRQGNAYQDVCRSQDVSAADCQTAGEGRENSQKTHGDLQNTDKGLQGQEQCHIQARAIVRETGIPTPTRSTMRIVQRNGVTMCSSQKRRPLRQSTSQLTNTVQLLPHERDEAQVVGSEEGRATTAKEQRADELEQKAKIDCCITSPPYIDSVHGSHGERETAAETTAKRRTEGGSLGQSQRHGGYGTSEGNIGNMPAGVVTNPPFADVVTTKDPKYVKEKKLYGDYGQSPGQLGNTTGPTYWQAMDEVYRQVYQVLRPGGVMMCVVKDFIKAGKRVPLCDQTLALLTHVGFEPVERIRAWLVKEDRHAGLFGGDVVQTKERKSFFRRLADKKGCPRLDWEEVLIVRKCDAK